MIGPEFKPLRVQAAPSPLNIRIPATPITPRHQLAFGFCQHLSFCELLPTNIDSNST